MLPNVQKISAFILYGLLIITAVLTGLFYLGGTEPETASSEFPEPVYTGALIYWIYFLVASGVLCTIGFGVYHFFKFLKNNPRQAFKSMSGVLVLAIIMILSWKWGSGSKLDIPNYTGNSNTYFWLKATDMYLFTVYFLLGASLCATIGFRIYHWLKQ